MNCELYFTAGRYDMKQNLLLKLYTCLSQNIRFYESDRIVKFPNKYSNSKENVNFLETFLDFPKNLVKYLGRNPLYLRCFFF